MKPYFKRTVLLLNNLDKIDNLLKKAIKFSSQHQTILEILYVHEVALFEIPDYFLSKDRMAKNQIDKEKIQAKIEESIKAFDEVFNHAILVYIDDTVDRVIQHAKKEKQILFITPYEPKLSESLIQRVPYSFLIIKDDALEEYNNIIVPLDLKEKSRKVLLVAKEIFATKPITILHDYRYLLDMMTIQVDYFNLAPITTPNLLELNQTVKADQQKSFEAYKKEFNIEGVFIDDDYSSLDKSLIEYISNHNFDLTLLYHQDTELFLSPSLIVELMKKVSTDLFILNLENE